MLRICFPLLLGCVLLPAQSKPAGPNREVVNNNLVRVLVANSTPGTKSRPHKHDVNRIMIYLDDGAQQLKFEDGAVKDQKWKAGDVILDPKGGMHTSENKHAKAFRIVEIELKKAGETVSQSKLDAVQVAPHRYKVILETEQVRVIRARYGPGDRLPLHEHVLPHVVVFLTDYHLGVRGDDGKLVEVKGNAGDAVMGGPVKHSETNRTNALLDLVMVEIKSKSGV
jgi:quercetin dioxygenase-like cupin family protein